LQVKLENETKREIKRRALRHADGEQMR
jgi:hypothetical protein